MILHISNILSDIRWCFYTLYLTSLFFLMGRHTLVMTLKSSISFVIRFKCYSSFFMCLQNNMYFFSSIKRFRENILKIILKTFLGKQDCKDCQDGILYGCLLFFLSLQQHFLKKPMHRLKCMPIIW